MLRVAEHVDAHCPALEPLNWTKERRKDPHRQRAAARSSRPKKASRPKKESAAAPKKTTTKPSPPPIQVLPETIVGAMRAANQDSVRLLCLYATSEARARMAGQLEHFAKGSAPSIDDQVATPCEGFEISFHRAVKLLVHGNHDRSGLLTEIDSILENTTGTVLAWVETAYDSAEGKPRDDAKTLVKNLLADRGITTQFLATQPEPTDPEDSTTKKKPKRRKKAETDVDHAAENAASDLLLRSAGFCTPNSHKVPSATSS